MPTAFGEPNTWYVLTATKRCRALGHRWAWDHQAQRWICVRYGCEAWYNPAMPEHVQSLAEEWYRDLPPLRPGEPWGSPDAPC